MKVVASMSGRSKRTRGSATSSPRSPDKGRCSHLDSGLVVGWQDHHRGHDHSAYEPHIVVVVVAVVVVVVGVGGGGGGGGNCGNVSFQCRPNGKNFAVRRHLRDCLPMQRVLLWVLWLLTRMKDPRFMHEKDDPRTVKPLRRPDSMISTYHHQKFHHFRRTTTIQY